MDKCKLDPNKVGVGHSVRCHLVKSVCKKHKRTNTVTFNQNKMLLSLSSGLHPDHLCGAVLRHVRDEGPYHLL